MNWSRMKGPLLAIVTVLIASGFFLLPQGRPRATHRFSARPTAPSHTRPRSSDDGAYVNVTITAAPGVINVNPAKSPASDVLIARLSNAGPARDNFFGMQPSGKATYRLYATPRFDAAHGAAMWKLVEVDGATGALTTVREGWFHDCQHNRVPTRADADFFPCTPHPLGSKFAKFKKAGMFTGFFSDRILAMMFPADTTDRDPNDPPWISCTTGCCTLEQ